ncbi:putative ATP-dependent DNA helicase HFM1 isoform X1 [Panthera onca]|nr:probable ATP-dependent DNA helicase HFM1 isoform X5 [Panthera onca]XP_060480928.1 probable ATP-dependent DNA helicase HFM1 isoform X5 [Panthera onca]XP_060480929.1 probable ATP-dependent DNA helicase HFM1 isoform X5 [Panthera onca]XP_060480930.1 probable ATP-dependent DNA helicase HFM1 isoform X5 [Panthera onca]
MLKSNDSLFALDTLSFERPDEAENYPDIEKSLDWFLPPAPLISEIPDTQALEEEIESHKLLGQEKKPKMLPSNLKITNEDTNYISPTQKFQFAFSSKKYEEDYLNLGGAGNDDLSHVPGKLTYGSSQKYKNHIGTEIAPEKNVPDDTKLVNFAEDKGESTSAFRKRLFKISDNIHEDVYSNDSTNLDFPVASVKIVPTEMNKGESWKCSNNKQRHQYSDINMFTASDVFSHSEIREDIFKAPTFSVTSQPHEVQGVTENDLDSLKAVTEIPSKFRSIFKEFPYFNYIQSKAFDDLLYTDRNFVVCAPTGSGKTVMFELAITRLLMEVPLPWSNIKIVYMAPIKALCSQRFDDWKEKFGSIGLNCKELTGDTVMDDLFEIQHAHIIMTTPEKWDSMTRKWRDNSLVQLVRLFLIDEVHVVKDENRGPTLEVVVSRMKTVQSLSPASENSSTIIPMRFVAVSATIPNAEDIAEWLSNGERPAVCLKVDEKHRPVKLRKVVLGFPCSSNQTEFKFDLTLNYKIANVIQTYSDQKPTLVFCATRKGVQQAALVLVKDAKFIMAVEQKQRLQKCAYSLRDSKLRDILIYGVAYHHAGMEPSDRKVVEGAFTVGDLPVLFTTSTLAMGVNLPAHLVVIKSTMHYAGGMFEEYSETDILQMIGRAGRPQFDTTATAVIMTRLSTKEKYIQMLACSDTVESSLHRHLIEHLNAEIVLHTITDVNIALEWIRSTLLYIRALKNPSHYGFASGLNKDGIEAKLQELCLKNLNDLSSLDLIRMDEDVNFKPTEAGRLMAWYYITFETVKKFCTISGKETLLDLVTMIASCKEFVDVQLRINEKKTLNTLNKDPHRVTIRFPMEGRIKTREMKVNCLIQAQLGCIPIQDFALTQDTSKIFRNGSRITRWLSDFVAVQEKKFAVLLNSLILAKCFRCKLWENSLHVSKQLEKIGITLSNAMVNAGLTSFKKIEETDARELELILNRHPPFGTQIKETVMYLPKYELEVEQIARYNDTMAEILVTIILRNFKQLQTKRTAPDSHYVTLIIGDADNQLVFKHKIMDSVLLKAGNWTKKIDVRRAFKSEDLSINLISSEYVGLDIQQKFTVFYLGPKRFGNQIIMQKKSETEISHSKHSNRSTITGSNKGMTACKKPGNRECNHHCKNKHTCGHDCCKTGVAQKSVMKESTISSYLSDLRNRNAVSSLPPVKRLKMQMNKSQSVDLKEFGFTPKPSLSSVSRSECLNTPELSIMEQRDQHEICAKVQQEPSEYQDKDFSRWNSSTTSNEKAPQTVLFNRHLNASGNQNLTDADKSNSPFSEVPNVNFELGDEVWDDFDDENLIEVTDFSAGTEKTNTSGFRNTLSSSIQGSKLSLQESKSKFQGEMSKSVVSSHEKPDIYLSDSPVFKFDASSMTKLPPQAGNADIVCLQERKQQSLSPEIEKLCFTHSKKIPNSSHFIEKVDFFISNNECKKEIDFRLVICIGYSVARLGRSKELQLPVSHRTMRIDNHTLTNHFVPMQPNCFTLSTVFNKVREIFNTLL